MISSAGVISSDQTAGGAAQLSSFFVTPAAAAAVVVLWCCQPATTAHHSTPQHRCCCSGEVQQKLHFYWQHSPAPGCCWDGGGQCPVSHREGLLSVYCLLTTLLTLTCLLTSRAESWREKMHNMISLGTMAYFLLHTVHLQIVLYKILKYIFSANSPW